MPHSWHFVTRALQNKYSIQITVIDPARNCDAHDAGVCRHNDSFEGCVWWRFVEGQIAEASEICAEKNSKLAVVENEDVYRKLVDNVTGGFNQTGYKVQLWTGMIFDPKVILFLKFFHQRWEFETVLAPQNRSFQILIQIHAHPWQRYTAGQDSKFLVHESDFVFVYFVVLHQLEVVLSVLHRDFKESWVGYSDRVAPRYWPYLWTERVTDSCLLDPYFIQQYPDCLLCNRISSEFLILQDFTLPRKHVIICGSFPEKQDLDSRALFRSMGLGLPNCGQQCTFQHRVVCLRKGGKRDDERRRDNETKRGSLSAH